MGTFRVLGLVLMHTNNGTHGISSTQLRRTTLRENNCGTMWGGDPIKAGSREENERF